MIYYSQHGEDVLAWLLLQEYSQGYFVEVGCIDGRRFSNTLFFEERGWKGMCVEAHEGYIDLIKTNRPGSCVVHCAVGEEDRDDVTFFATDRGSLSTLDERMQERWKREFPSYFNGFVPQKVSQRKLDTLFGEYGVGEIDLLSIDIEGYEAEALRGLALQQFRPKVMIIESDSAEHEAALDQLICTKGYTKIMKLYQNLFYVRDDVDTQRVVSTLQMPVMLYHTAHVKMEEPGRWVVGTLIGKDQNAMASYLLKVDRTIQENARYVHHHQGFHGDRYLIDCVDRLLPHIDCFVETGANVATTLCHVATRRADLECFSCEPDPDAFAIAEAYCSDYRNVRLYPQVSETFIHTLLPNLAAEQPLGLYWLDAHGNGFAWPLREEVEMITTLFDQAWMMIDDFLVPDLECFGYDAYDGQECSFEYIKASFNPRHSYEIYYPTYRERTSKHHPLRGWVLIAWGKSVRHLLKDMPQVSLWSQYAPLR